MVKSRDGSREMPQQLSQWPSCGAELRSQHPGGAAAPGDLTSSSDLLRHLYVHVLICSNMCTHTYTSSYFKAEREECLWPASSFLFCQSRTMKQCRPHSGWVFPAQWTQLRKFSTGMLSGPPELDSSSFRLPYQVIQDSIKLTIRANLRTDCSLWADKFSLFLGYLI